MYFNMKLKFFKTKKNKSKEIKFDKSNEINKFKCIKFSEEFIEFYNKNDYLYSVLKDLNEYVNCNCKISETIFDYMEIFNDYETYHFIDLFYLNDGDYFIKFVLQSNTAYIGDQLKIVNYLLTKWIDVEYLITIFEDIFYELRIEDNYNTESVENSKEDNDNISVISNTISVISSTCTDKYNKLFSILVKIESKIN